MKKRRIAVISGSRADYAHLYPVMKKIRSDPAFELITVVTGMHLSPEYGMTYKCLEQDEFKIDAKIETVLSNDSAVGITKSMGLGLIGFADAFAQLNPDLILVLGDRYEIFVAVQAALIAKIPVAHIAGGDSTQGAYDEAMRHSITKMSHLHFTTNPVAYTRVMQMGECSNYVFNTGSPSLDLIGQIHLLSTDEIATKLNIKFSKTNFLVTFHPPTLDDHNVLQQTEELLCALSHFKHDTTLIFTYSNADNHGLGITRLIKEYVKQNDRAYLFKSLGNQLYFSLLNTVDIVVGNSSSGLYEAPSFRTATVNIGDRQTGRVCADSVVNCTAQREQIINAIDRALKIDTTSISNPYGDGNSSEKIMTILKSIDNLQSLLKKKFHDIQVVSNGH